MNTQCKFEKSLPIKLLKISKCFALYSGVLIKFFRLYQLLILIHSILFVHFIAKYKVHQHTRISKNSPFLICFSFLECI